MNGAAARGAWGRPRPYAGLARELGRYAGIAFLRLAGWSVQGDWPRLPKAVLVAAPHTSNWDGVYMLAAAAYYRIGLKWMGKDSLVRGPLGPVMRALGCVPVDRSGPNDLVQTMTLAFAAKTEMVLAVPPEGTRSLSPVWKSGFYHIARMAGLPIILAIMDYGTKTITIAGVFTPSGDYAADLPVIQAYYKGASGKHKARFAAGA